MASQHGCDPIPHPDRVAHQAPHGLASTCSLKGSRPLSPHLCAPGTLAPAAPGAHRPHADLRLSAFSGPSAGKPFSQALGSLPHFLRPQRRLLHKASSAHPIHSSACITSYPSILPSLSPQCLIYYAFTCSSFVVSLLH